MYFFNALCDQLFGGCKRIPPLGCLGGSVFKRITHFWVQFVVKRRTLDLSSGPEFMVHEFEPWIGPCHDLCPPGVNSSQTQDTHIKFNPRRPCTVRRTHPGMWT